MADGRERPQYEHDPSRGETRFPPQEGEQHGPHEPGRDDPHAALNTPADDAGEEAVGGQSPHKEGMGNRPPARGERGRASEPDPYDAADPEGA